MSSRELTDEEKILIIEKFEEEIAPKLMMKTIGRVGVVNCSFAGEKYKNWNLIFRAKGDSFEVIDFEYDEDSRGLELK